MEDICESSFRIITALSVTLPPVPWYKKIRIPGLVTRHSSHSNSIRTTKYTAFNFVLKNLWEQFHRLANIYFLFVVLLNTVPQVGAIVTEIAYLPLLFVLSTTAIKDIFEDYRRFKSDKEVNNRLCLVYDKKSGSYINQQWSKVCVGDFVQLLSDDIIPADLLFIHSSDPLNICYIETANIDGETNLKPRYVAPGSGRHHDAENEVTEMVCSADFTGTLYCEEPHNKIYGFNGYVETSNGERSGVDRSNLLLRGCVLRNTARVVGLVVYAGHQTKSMLNNSGPRTKRSKLERAINIEIVSQVGLLFFLCLIGAIVNGVWTYRHLDTNAPFFPYTSVDVNFFLQGFIRFLTYLIIFQVIIPISLYVTIEVVKLVQVYFINWDLEMYYAANNFPFQCRALNISEDLGQIQYVFSDKTGTLTENKMVFYCCSVGGIDYPHALADDLLKVHNSGGRDGPVDNDSETVNEEDEDSDFSIMV